MEILSPAGYTEQINTAILAGANAVYGGFRNWNARNNAVNFSVYEYNSIVDKLHSVGLKFYLTLNTLMLDSEIEELMSFMCSKKLNMPDAFIVADLGLLLVLKERYPDIPLHISTQFGVHCISDIRLLEELGAERVILARELKMHEVEIIRKATHMELECFVWGSQCVGFSGLCYFGSLLNGGSGNRGKCVIMCRDKYLCNDKYGNIFYVHDMNCISKVPYLQDNDVVDSVKIEGRRRTCQEISDTIHQIQNQSNDEQVCGFLCVGEDNNIKCANMHDTVHNRLKLLYPFAIETHYNAHDVYVATSVRPYQYCKNDCVLDVLNKESAYYVYTEYTSYDIKKNNVYFDFVLTDNCVSSLNFTNHRGEFCTITNAVMDEFTEFNIDQFILQIRINYPNINVARLKYFKNRPGKVYISQKFQHSIINMLSEMYPPETPNAITSSYSPLHRIYVEVNDTKYVDSLLKIENVIVVYSIKSPSEMNSLQDFIKHSSDKIIFKLPIFDWDNTLERYIKVFEGKNVMFTRFSQIISFSNIALNHRYIDYTCSTWNSYTLEWLLGKGIDMFSCSPELSVDDNLSIFKNRKTLYTFAGKLPLFYSRHCFKDVLGCFECGGKKKVQNIDKMLGFQLACFDDCRELYYDRPMLNGVFGLTQEQSNIEYRYVVGTESIENVIQTVKIVLSENDFCDILKQTIPYWQNSYENNIFSSSK